MSNKRSKGKKNQQVYCIYCERRLWRLGSLKHFLFYTNESEIGLNLNTSRQNPVFLAPKGIDIDHNSWIEEFICGEHGKMWMLVCKKADGTIVTVPARSHDWECSTAIINPDILHPSVI
jgi:hypothetical protein